MIYIARFLCMDSLLDVRILNWGFLIKYTQKSWHLKKKTRSNCAFFFVGVVYRFMDMCIALARNKIMPTSHIERSHCCDSQVRPDSVWRLVFGTRLARLPWRNEILFDWMIRTKWHTNLYSLFAGETHVTISTGPARDPETSCADFEPYSGRWRYRLF